MSQQGLQILMFLLSLTISTQVRTFLLPFVNSFRKNSSLTLVISYFIYYLCQKLESTKALSR